MFNSNQKTIRQPAVAGAFYPSDPTELSRAVDSYLDSATYTAASGTVKAILVPHAGYVYSGPVAACAYGTLKGRRAGTVVLMSNAHSAYVRNAVIDGQDAWRTPLGDAEVDAAMRARLVEGKATPPPSTLLRTGPAAAGHSPQGEIRIDSPFEGGEGDDGSIFTVNTSTHARDHTLEVQLPFLQRALKPGFKILPLMFGDTDEGAPELVAQALAAVLDDNDLVVVSTDLSHYPEYEDAKRIDKKTLEMIADLDSAGFDAHVNRSVRDYPEGVSDAVVPAPTAAESPASGRVDSAGAYIQNLETLCCGPNAVKTLIALAKIKGWNVRLLKYANSGDSPAGDKGSVVGYGAVLFLDNRRQITDDRDGGLHVQQIPPSRSVRDYPEGVSDAVVPTPTAAESSASGRVDSAGANNE